MACVTARPLSLAAAVGFCHVSATSLSQIPFSLGNPRPNGFGRVQWAARYLCRPLKIVNPPSITEEETVLSLIVDDQLENCDQRYKGLLS